MHTHTHMKVKWVKEEKRWRYNYHFSLWSNVGRLQNKSQGIAGELKSGSILDQFVIKGEKE